MSGSYWTFVAISAVVIATPGPDTALTIRNTLAGGRAGGICTAIGVACGQLIWALFTSLGLVALLLASETVFQALKLVGAAYLVWLGAQSLYAALRQRDAGRGAVARPRAGRLPQWKAFRQGVINDLANPKMAVFFASVLPQFAPEGRGMFSELVLLGGLFATLTLAWLALYAIVLSAAGRLLERPAIRRALDATAGTALVGLGLRVAVSER